MNTSHLVAAIVGGALIWALATLVERSRRARADLRGAKTLVKTLRRVFWRSLAAVGRAGLLVLLLLAIAVALVATTRGKS